jgi:hypothetical protein
LLSLHDILKYGAISLIVHQLGNVFADAAHLEQAHLLVHEMQHAFAQLQLNELIGCVLMTIKQPSHEESPFWICKIFTHYRHRGP